MKAKALLYLAVVVGLLLPLGAGPVMAEEAIPMWVHRLRVAYTGRSSTGPDDVVAFAHIRDATLDMVAGAKVTAEWKFYGAFVKSETVETNAQGIAVFKLWLGRGVYQICVTDVTKPGWDWDPDLDREECPEFTVP